MRDEEYYIVKKKALPEVLLKVVEAKRLIDSERVMTVQEATEAVNISRSSFYKYRDDIFPFYEHSRKDYYFYDADGRYSWTALKGLNHGKITGNILTIHQTIRSTRLHMLTLEILPRPRISAMLRQ